MTRAKSWVGPTATNRDCCASLDLPHAEHADDCRRLQSVNIHAHPNRPVGRTLNKAGTAKTVNARLSDSTFRSLDALCYEYGVTRSTLVRVALRYALKNKAAFVNMIKEEPF